MKSVFGPVPSRRLGQSLGIDPVPFKTCNWNCVYCQLGRTAPFALERREYVPKTEILAQVQEILAERPRSDVDWVSFVRSGENCLQSELGWLINAVKQEVGADMIKKQAALGFALKRDEATEERMGYEDMRKKLTETLKRAFRPEFINRLDSVIVFRSLSKEDIQKIVKLELDKVSARLVEHNIALTATSEALASLGTEGFDPEMGARPLRRVIQQKVEDKLSDRLLSGDFKDGDAIQVELGPDGEIILTRLPVAETESEPEPAA